MSIINIDKSIAQGILPVVYYHLSLAYRHASGKRVRSRTFTLVRPDNPSTDSRYDCHGHIDHHLFASVSSVATATGSHGNRHALTPSHTSDTLAVSVARFNPRSSNLMTNPVGSRRSRHVGGGLMNLILKVQRGIYEYNHDTAQVIRGICNLETPETRQGDTRRAWRKNRGRI
jgi:hypothetical protein